MTDPMLDDLDFEGKIGGLTDRELMEFTARQVFGMTKVCASHGKRIDALEKQRGIGPKIVAGIGAAVGGAVAGAVYGIIAIVRDR